MTSGFCSALALLFWVLSAGEEEGPITPAAHNGPSHILVPIRCEV
jgi:hypothetical protein